MAGYVGTKAVLLSTTAATVGGDADIGGDLTVDTNTLHVDSTNNRIGVGTSSPATALEVKTGSSGTQPLLTLYQADNTASNKWGINFSRTTGSASADVVSKLYANREGGDATGLTFDVTNSGGTTSEAMRLDSSGHLLVGTTDSLPVANNDASGIALRSDGNAQFSRSGAATARFNRGSSDGEIVSFNKDSSTVGSIGNAGANAYIGTGDTGLLFGANVDAIIPTNQGATRDNAIDLGNSGNRFNDAFITNGVTTGSDGNDKQDIRDLTEAEQRVAVVCKGLLKAWRWKSAVEEKGDDARIHCGIIAQDLQAAFAAEGLDAGRYAMFMSNTWWETQTEIPAVGAVAEVLDEDGNVVTEAVEAVDAYTRTDTYDTQEEAPEGATERTRLGVRYSELLAFIIGAL